MDAERRAEIADYIAAGIRYAVKTAMAQWPDGAILCVKSFSELAGFDGVAGMEVWIMDMPSSFDFFVAFPSKSVAGVRLQKAFLEYLELFSLKEIEE